MHGRYIAIEGPIGVGKSTLAARLGASLGLSVLAEAPEDNPFLAAFYDDPPTHALAAQLFFSLQRARQIDDLRENPRFAGGCVADFMFAKDPLFARLNLSGAELALYDAIYARLARNAPTPDCVLYLYAPTDVLLQRIARRDRAAERSLSAAYLRTVIAAYRDFFATFDRARLIRVNTAACDLVDSPDDFAALSAAVNDTSAFIALGESRG